MHQALGQARLGMYAMNTEAPAPAIAMQHSAQAARGQRGGLVRASNDVKVPPPSRLDDVRRPADLAACAGRRRPPARADARDQRAGSGSGAAVVSIWRGRTTYAAPTGRAFPPGPAAA